MQDEKTDFERLKAPRPTRKNAGVRTLAIYGFALALVVALLYFAY